MSISAETRKYEMCISTCYGECGYTICSAPFPRNLPRSYSPVLTFRGSSNFLHEIIVCPRKNIDASEDVRAKTRVFR